MFRFPVAVGIVCAGKSSMHAMPCHTLGLVCALRTSHVSTLVTRSSLALHAVQLASVECVHMSLLHLAGALAGYVTPESVASVLATWDVAVVADHTWERLCAADVA